MERITLNKPLLVNGQEMNELTLDFDLITTQDFMQASGEATASVVQCGGVTLGTEFDPAFHLALAFRAVVHGTKGVSLMDAKRIGGRDLLVLQRAGRNFCLGGLSAD